MRIRSEMMKNNSGRNQRGHDNAVLLRLLPVTLLALPLAACDSVLEVDDPDVARPETIRDPENLSGLRVGALGDLMVAYGGNATEGIVLSAGMLADELYVSDTFGTRQEVDQRRITAQNSGLTSVFLNLHRARRAAEIAAEQYAANTDHDRYSDVAHAEVTSLAAYAYTIFGENYCSGVPFSRLTEDNQIEHGDPWTTQQMYDRALAGFREAQTITTNSTQLNLARIGEARTLLNAGQFADAAAVVAAVPTSFVYLLEHSDNTARQNNGIWLLSHSRAGYGLAHLEGLNGLPFRQGSSQIAASQDPRVPYTRTNARAWDNPYAHFWQLKYPARGSAVAFATGIEARLIEAEAALDRGSSNAYLPILNGLRQDIGLAALSDPGTADERVDQFFKERGFWLYLTGHRLSDLRRLVRQYGRDSEAVFPTGRYGRFLFSPATGNGALPDDQLEWRDHNITYGADVNLPVPFDEQNNPNDVQCIDRNA